MAAGIADDWPKTLLSFFAIRLNCRGPGHTWGFFDAAPSEGHFYIPVCAIEMKKNILICFGLALLMMAGLPAEGFDQITQNGSFSVQSTNWNSTAALDKFDGTVGNLLSVELSLFGNIYANAGYENLAVASNDIVLESAASIYGQVHGTSVPFDITIAPNHVGTFNGVPSFDGTTNFSGTSGQLLMGLTGSDTGSFSTTSFHPVVEAIVLPNFIDADGMAGGLDTLLFEVDASGSSRTTDSQGNVASMFQTTAAASYELVYTYETGEVSAVPEPATMFIALLGLVLLPRRRRR